VFVFPQSRPCHGAQLIRHITLTPSLRVGKGSGFRTLDLSRLVARDTCEKDSLFQIWLISLPCVLSWGSAMARRPWRKTIILGWAEITAHASTRMLLWIEVFIGSQYLAYIYIYTLSLSAFNDHQTSSLSLDGYSLPPFLSFFVLPWFLPFCVSSQHVFYLFPS